MDEKSELTPELFAELWTSARAGKAPDDPELAAFQKFMLLHEDMHDLLDRFVADPSTPLVVNGEHAMMHIAMDVSTERSLSIDQPAGIRDVFGRLTQAGFPEGDAFHVIAQAYMHAVIQASEAGREADPAALLERARSYAEQAIASRS